jgi:hypothetical protein
MQHALETGELSGQENISSTAPSKGMMNTTKTAQGATPHDATGDKFDDRIELFQNSAQTLLQQILHKLLEKFYLLRTAGISNLYGTLVVGVTVGCIIILLALQLRLARHSEGEASAMKVFDRKAVDENVKAAKKERLSREASSNRRRKQQRKLREAMGASAPQDTGTAVVLDVTGPHDARILQKESVLEEEGEWERIGKPSPNPSPKKSKSGAMAKSLAKPPSNLAAKTAPKPTSKPAPKPLAEPTAKSATNPLHKPATKPTTKLANKSTTKPTTKASQFAAPENVWTSVKFRAPNSPTNLPSGKNLSANKPSKPEASKSIVPTASPGVWSTIKNPAAKPVTQKSNSRRAGSPTSAKSIANKSPKPKAEASNQLPPNGKLRASHGAQTNRANKNAKLSASKMMAAGVWGNGPTIPSLVFNDLIAKSEHKMLSPSYSAAGANQNFEGGSAKKSDSRNGSAWSNTPQRSSLGLHPTN